ncbi:MAG: CocE/NonD family hydrolase [Alphaproteobacteria bacterium]
MKWLRGLFFVIVLLCAVILAGYLARHELTRIWGGLPAFTHGAGDSFERMVPMRDGVALFTTIDLPSGGGPFPTVLMRSPYAQIGWLMRDLTCGRFVRYGYACVYQDTRGQGRSEGAWDPGANPEMADGRATLAWLTDQDFQDGNIAMVGASYLASVQFAALADGAPPALKTIVPSMVSTDNRGVMYQDGMFRHETYTAWASLMRDPDGRGGNPGKDYQKAIRHRPHNEVDTEIFGAPMPWYRGMLAATSPAADYWQRKDRVKMRTVPQDMTIPVLMIGGWYDVFFGPQFEDWQRLATRSRSRYIIGPWTHSGGTGDLDTPNAGGGRFQWLQMLPWLDHHLKGASFTGPTGLSLYVMGGDGDWQQHDEWPITAASRTFHLSNLDAASTCNGGALAAEAGTGKAVYTYDPDNPVPTRGGAGMLAAGIPGFGGAPRANVEQAGMCEREDVLTFQSAPLPDGLFISGQISVTLDVSSSAPDTAFTAKLIEVFADGRSFNIRDSVTSLAYRNMSEVPLDYTPGDRVSVTLDVWPIAWRMQPGSRLRLDVSSSDFPKFHAHTNRAGPWAEQTGADIATQTVYGGRVDLPVERY